jgi:hypothetical protein
MGSYSGTIVIGYGGTVTVWDRLGLVSLMVGLMWQMCQGQHMDVWIPNSRTWGRKTFHPKRRACSDFIFGVTMEKVLEVYEDRYCVQDMKACGI